MRNLDREKILEIIKLLDNAIDMGHDEINGNIETEEFGSSFCGDLTEIFNTLIIDVGNIIGIDLSLDTTMSIDDIVAELKINMNPHSYEELEELDSWSDSDSEPKYVYLNMIMKYKPTSETYRFVIQTSGYEYLSFENYGKVTKEEIITTKWCS